MRGNRKYWRSVVAIMGVSLGFIVLATMAQARTTKRPISDFVDAQGTTMVFTPPVPDQIGWSTPSSQPMGRFALFDYAGLADEFLQDCCGISLGTQIAGSVIERPLKDGRVEVTVVLHTKNALTWAIPFDPMGPITQFNDNPLLFGFRAQDLVDDPSLEPALGESHLQVVFRNTAPGAPLPDLVCLNLGTCLEGFELISLYFSGNAMGPLREDFGVPDGTPGRLIVTQIGVLFRGPFMGATGDGFPVERVELRVIGQ